MLDNLELQEQAMTQMFSGTTLHQEETIVVKVPITEELKEAIAFRFSSKLGLLDANNLAGAPIYLSLTNVEPLPVDPEGESKKEKKRPEGIIYNIPGKGKVTVRSSTKSYIETELPITQFGTTEVLMDNLFNKKTNTRVIFNPNTGGIVKIDKD